jgi:RimJ/RimL family protein N-acetyltransferase
MSLILETERLVLRSPTASDARAIVAGVGDFEVARNLARVPHPYTQSDAEAFLARVGVTADLVLGITLKSGAAYIGGCGAHACEDGAYEIGYWLARPYWGFGYASEAARAVVHYAFEALGATYLTAGWFDDNPNSGRVLQKLGFLPAGVSLRDCLARRERIFCHDMILEPAMASAPIGASLAERRCLRP